MNIWENETVVNFTNKTIMISAFVGGIILFLLIIGLLWIMFGKKKNKGYIEYEGGLEYNDY